MVALLCVSGKAVAQQPSVPPEVANKLADDLAKLQDQIQTAQQQAVAQAASPRQQVQVTRDAYVLGGADPNAAKEFAASKGQDLYVLDKANNYCAVADSSGATGWITAADVKPKWAAEDVTWTSGRDAWGDVPHIVWRYAPTSQTTSQNTSTPHPSQSTSTPPSQNTSTQTPQATPQSSDNSVVSKVITDAAVQFLDSYKNNQYIQVTGFSVNIGLAPSLNLSFGFK